VNNLTKIASLVAVIGALAACSDADVASSNISKAADNFEINRRVVFYNGITERLHAKHRGSVQSRKPG
jgi:hypothetical protein